MGALPGGGLGNRGPVRSGAVAPPTSALRDRPCLTSGGLWRAANSTFSPPGPPRLHSLQGPRRILLEAAVPAWGGDSGAVCAGPLENST